MHRLVIILVLLISIITAAVVLAEDMPGGEQLLTYRGIAYGIANDPAGNLTITDWKMGEVWRVDPVTGGYTLYSGLGNTLDARVDAAGDIWLTSFWNPYLNRINTSANPVSMTTWDLTTWDSSRAYKLSGLAFDDQGKVWFSEWGEVSDTQLLYRFDPQMNQLCGYTLPGGNHSWYLLYQAPYLWLGDWTQALILRFNTTTQEVTYWGAGTKAEPRGLALDADSNIWWADMSTGKIGQLNPGTNALKLFSLPDAGSPNYARPYMISVHEGLIWYTAQGDEIGTLGMLDPTVATEISSTAKRLTFHATETCQSIIEATTSSIETINGVWAEPWPARLWPDVTPLEKPGWRVYEAPGAESPYGISVDQNKIWFTDQMYNKLVRFDFPKETPSSTPSLTLTPTSTNQITSTPSPTSTSTATFTSTATPTTTKTPSNTPTRTPTATSTPTKTKTATKTSTPTITIKPSNTPTRTPTATSTSTRTTQPSSPTASNSQTATPNPILLNTPTIALTPDEKKSDYQVFLPLILFNR